MTDPTADDDRDRGAVGGRPPRGVRPPERVVQAARAAFGQRSEGAVALLSYDSLIDGGGTATDHELRFEHPAARVVVRVTASDGGSDLTGRLEPALDAEVVVLPANGGEEGGAVGAPVGTVEHGEFRLPAIHPGRVCLAFVGMGNEPILATDVFRLGH